jgi:hypothetical protein
MYNNPFIFNDPLIYLTSRSTKLTARTTFNLTYCVTVSFVKRTQGKKEEKLYMFYKINIIPSYTVTRQEIPVIPMGIVL